MPKSAPPRRPALVALAIATLSLVINFWAWSLLSPLGSQYAADLALQPLTLSLLLAAPVIVGSLGRILLGMLTDTYGGKAMFIATSFLMSLPVIGLTMVDGFGQLLAVATLLGLGGAVFAIGIPYISAWFAPKRRGLMLGLYSVGNAGTALSAFATPRLVDSLGRDQTFWLVAGLLIISGLVFVAYGRNSPSWRPSKGSPLQRMLAAARQRTTWDLSIVYIISFGAFVAFGVYLPVLLNIAYDLSLTDAASRAAGFVLLATIARPIGGWLSDKLGGKNVIRVGLLAVAVLAGFVALQPTLAVQTTIAYLSLAFTLGCCNGAVFAMVGRIAKPQFMGSMTGIIGAAGGLGGFLPPLILGATYQYTESYSAALMMLAIGAVIAFVYIHRRFRDKKLYRYRPS